LEKLNILILDGSGRQCLPFMRSLKRAGHSVAVVCPNRWCEGHFSRYADKRLIWPDVSKDEQGFHQCLVDYLRNNHCNVILPLGDISAHFVSLNKQELSEYTSMPVPDYDVFMRAADKVQTMNYCMTNGIPCPRTYDAERESLEEMISKVPFPVMVKPSRGIGAIGLHRLENADELRKHYGAIRERYGPLIIQEFIPLSGTQFQAEAFCNAQSEMTVCMVIGKPRFFPVTGGTSTCNITINRPDIVENVRRLLEGIRWVGSADVDLILDPRDNTPKILEINPRVTAGIKIGFEAGIDYADLQIRLALGKDIPIIKNYKLGIVLRNLCLDILWYVYSDRQARKKTLPSFWKFFGSNIKYQTFRIDDPFPILGFVIGNIIKYRSPETRSAKLGTDL
jgi:D-aspartate ligase